MEVSLWKKHYGTQDRQDSLEEFITFTTQYDFFQVINQLMLQRSRYEFLSMLLEVEGRKHRDSHHLLGAVRTLLEGDAVLVDRRHVSLLKMFLFIMKNYDPQCVGRNAPFTVVR